MVEDKGTKILHLILTKTMYDDMIKQYGDNGGFDPTKVKLVTYPIINNG